MGDVHAGRGFPRKIRLRRSADFALLARDRSGPHFTRSWLALSARERPGERVAAAGSPGAAPASIDPDTPGIRIGFTASGRNAPRAVARNTVKRVLREAARHSALANAAAPMDLVLRLRTALPAPREMGWSAVKRELRLQADGLLERAARIAR